ncbi:hypothetical protein EV715DRAFT_246023 [Schizophyllum commune]
MPATHRRSRSHLAITGQGAGLCSDAEVCWGVLRVVLVLVPVCQLVVQCPNRPARAADAYRRAATCANREVSRHTARDWPAGLLMSATWPRSVDESKSRSLQLLSTISRHLLDFFLQLAGALPDLASAPPREGQLTVDELAQRGVKVRDFAFATGVPPIVANDLSLPANHPVLRKQFQPDPHTESMKRSSAEAKNEPTSKPQSKRSRLQREDTEPAIDEISSQSQGNFLREATPPQMYGVVGGSTSPARALSRSPSPWVPTPRASPSPPPTSLSGNYPTDAQSAFLAAISQPMDSQALSEQSQLFYEFASVPASADDACPSTRSSPGAASGSSNFAGPSRQRDDSELVAGPNMDDDSMDVDVVPSDTAPPEMSSSYPPPTAAPLGPATRRSRPAKQLSPRRYNLRRRPISSSPPLKARKGTQARTASPGSSPLRVVRDARNGGQRGVRRQDG